MRAAPPVHAALGSGQLERMLITLLHGMAGASVAVWLALHAELSPLRWPAAAGVLAACLGMLALGGWLAWRALPSAPGSLRWDGEAWSLDAGVQPQVLQHLVVSVDLGIWVLLQLRPRGGGGRAWRVASAGSAQAQWHGLRVALAAHAGAARTLDAGVAP